VLHPVTHVVLDTAHTEGIHRPEPAPPRRRLAFRNSAASNTVRRGTDGQPSHLWGHRRNRSDLRADFAAGRKRRWHGWVGTSTGVALITVAVLPLAALAVWALARRRSVTGTTPAWRMSLAEVGIVYGTIAWIRMIMLPGSRADAVPARVSLVPGRDLLTILADGPLTGAGQVVGNLLVFAAGSSPRGRAARWSCAGPPRRKTAGASRQPAPTADLDDLAADGRAAGVRPGPVLRQRSRRRTNLSISKR
jgi:hypothetical protein